MTETMTDFAGESRPSNWDEILGWYVHRFPYRKRHWMVGVEWFTSQKTRYRSFMLRLAAGPFVWEVRRNYESHARRLAGGTE